MEYRYVHTYSLAIDRARALLGSIARCARAPRPQSRGVGHDHVCAIFADSAPSNLCIIGDRGISADIC